MDLLGNPFVDNDRKTISRFSLLAGALSILFVVGIIVSLTTETGAALLSFVKSHQAARGVAVARATSAVSHL